MFYLQRSDAHMRNEWSNYTNWPYNYKPYDITDVSNLNTGYAGTRPSGFKITGQYYPENTKEILVNMGILIDGQYRENTMLSGILNYIEKFTRTNGNAIEGLYCYNFCLNTSPFDLQPSGAMDMSRYSSIQFELSTITPLLDNNAQTITICDPDTGDIIGINKPNWRIYKYNYDLTIFEERINMLTFVSGNAGLMYAT
jgi:hypothetical protein